MRRIAVFVIATVLLMGCAGLRQPSNPEARERTVLAVENQGFADMTIYVLDGSRRIRVGTAPGHTTTELTLPMSVTMTTGMIKFLADPIGGSRNSVSNEIPMTPGTRVTLIIPSR